MVPVTQNSTGLLAREFHSILRNGGTQDVVEPGYALDLLLHRRVRHQDRVVLVLPGNGQSLGCQHGDDLARQVLYSNHLPDGTRRAKELITDGPTDYADIRCVVDIIRRKRGAISDFPAFDVQILRRYSPITRIPVLIPVADLCRSIDIGRYALDQRNLRLDRKRVTD